MLGLSEKLYYISSCYFLKKNLYVWHWKNNDSSHSYAFWVINELRFRYSVWRKPASLFIWESRQSRSVSGTTVDFELVKSKSHAACVSPVSFMVWNPREALDWQRSRVRLSYIGLAFAFLLYFMACVVCSHMSNFSFDLLSRRRSARYACPLQWV